MPTVICTPALKCPFCSSETLTLFRSDVHLTFDIANEGEKKESAPVAALFCGENHFFFLRRSDIQIQEFTPQTEQQVARA